MSRSNNNDTPDESMVLSGTPSEYKINDRLYKWCQSEDSVSSLLAADPNLTPAEAWQKLIDHNNWAKNGQEEDHRDTIAATPVTAEELQRARMCGKWGSREPSDLFIRLYHDALCTLNDDPERGMVSPSLMGSSGTVPMTIISVLPDIARHMSNLIVRAEKEVFLATNFWQNSTASRYITDAIRELSRRAEARGTRIVMKVIYDRGDPKQVFDPHHVVAESQYTGGSIGLPPSGDIPYVDLEVMNYHQPLLGTFHAKYMVVDRRIGIIQSNNIQDNDNLEMMVQVEGPIVDSLYDMAMLSWFKKLDPPLPCLRSPAAEAKAAGLVSFDTSHANIFSPSGSIKGHSAIVDPTKMPPRRQPYGLEASKTLNSTNSSHQNGHHEPATPNQGDISTAPSSSSSSPAHASDIWPEHTPEDPHYDGDLADEVFRVQAAISAKPTETTSQAVTRHLNHTTNAGYPGDAPDSFAPADEMTPYIPHPAHEPFPMALVSRAPYGRPNHRSVANPQNAAWLSALRNARRSVFIQTPTLNAEPLIPAIVEACERGVDVYCYVCLGYNDAGEMLPMQGGHNDKIAHQLHKTLSSSPSSSSSSSSSTARQRLHWHWYVAKDQTRPIPSVPGRKARSCHVKLMIVDAAVGLVGNGNQDTQSWYHSQEVNLMLDSPRICRAWIDALRRNQNTGVYGAVDREDGVWRDEEGKEVEGATGVDAGRFSWFSGVVGAVRRLQGTGGF